MCNRVDLVAQQQARISELRAAKYEAILKSRPEMTLVQGDARFQDTHTLIVDREQGEFVEIQADRFLIATDSSPAIPPISGLADTPYWTSTEALVAKKLPEHLIVIGYSIVAFRTDLTWLPSRRIVHRRVV